MVQVAAIVQVQSIEGWSTKGHRNPDTPGCLNKRNGDQKRKRPQPVRISVAKGLFNHHDRTPVRKRCLRCASCQCSQDEAFDDATFLPAIPLPGLGIPIPLALAESSVVCTAVVYARAMCDLHPEPVHGSSPPLRIDLVPTSLYRQCPHCRSRIAGLRTTEGISLHPSFSAFCCPPASAPTASEYAGPAASE